jgi:hypothetical protein
MIATTIYSQNLTTTLGTNGSFIIKDGANTFLTLDQATGYLTLKSGVIFIGANRFLHNYGANNTFVGINSGNFTMTGTYNIAMGDQSLLSNTTGNYNTALGVNTLNSNTTGERNTAVGISSLYSNTTGNYNTAVGNGSLSSNTIGYENTALGNQSLGANTEGSFNTALGYRSLYQSTTADQNTAIGYQSLFANTTGASNTASGHNSLVHNTTGDKNTASGDRSLYSNTTGSQNTAIGDRTGYSISTGSNNTAIGYDAQVNGISSNQVRIGNTFVTYAGIQVAWTITSDKRWKSDINNSELGLGFISKLNPVSYTRINDEKKRTEYGLIAQEVEKVLKESGIENAGMLTIDDNGRYELRYNDLLAPMIKAIQELKEEKVIEIAELKTANDVLKTTTVALTDRITRFEQIQNMLAAEIEKLKTHSDDKTKVSLGEK